MSLSRGGVCVHLIHPKYAHSSGKRSEALCFAREEQGIASSLLVAPPRADPGLSTEGLAGRG